MRIDGRSPENLRNIIITPEYTRYAEGSVLVEFGHTKVACTATLEPSVPKWLMGTQKGWVTAEYGMLPRSTHTRMNREKTSTSGRSMEISRLIARSLRSVVDLKMLSERSIVVDCDVIQADGGTRTAAITGGFVALALALQKMKTQKMIAEVPLKDYVSAVSVGLSKEGPILDLKYEEDSDAETDMNVVMTGSGHFVEIQGTAEGAPFSKEDLGKMLGLAELGCKTLFAKQSEIIGSFFPYKKT